MACHSTPRVETTSLASAAGDPFSFSVLLLGVPWIEKPNGDQPTFYDLGPKLWDCAAPVMPSSSPGFGAQYCVLVARVPATWRGG